MPSLVNVNILELVIGITKPGDAWINVTDSRSSSNYLLNAESSAYTR
jgi:hypothetical protein